MDAYAELQRLLDSKIPVIGLVYEGGTTAGSTDAPRAGHLINLTVTAEQLLTIMRHATSGNGPAASRASQLRLPAGLTEQEFRVLSLIGAGLSNAEIAARLYLSINSVKTYIRLSYRKIGVTSRPGAIRWALKHGLSSALDDTTSEAGPPD